MTEATSRYTVWTESGAGEFIKATSVIVIGNTVSFFLHEREVKSYHINEFLKYNPDWKLLENTD